MKVNTGVIVYIVGGEDPYDDFDMKEAVRRLNINADRVEVFSPGRVILM